VPAFLEQQQENPMILVTGATGTVGRLLLRQLSAHGEQVRAFVRNLEHKVSFPGVESVSGDFCDPVTFLPALEGVDRLFLLVPSSPEVEAQQKAFVDAAKRRKVRHIVYLSQFGANTDSSGRFQRYHGAVEDYIRESGLAFTFLRPNLFMQALLNFRSTISVQGALYTPAGEGRVSVVDVRDIAAVAEQALLEPGHEGKVYTITGPEALSHAEIAAQLTEVLTKPVHHIDISSERMREVLLSVGMPPWQVDGVVEDYQQYRNDEAAEVTSTVKEVTGQEAHRFAEFVRDYAPEFGTKVARP
jgi:uncharacterized protein YbjT (DUF2867 family)